MSTRTTSKTGWTMPSLGQDALWGAAAFEMPPMGTPGRDVLRGGNDAIMGNEGNDKLYGGAGADHFRFDSKLNAKTNVDRIMDFKPDEDVLELARSPFSKAGKAGGVLKESAFYVGKKAHDKDDRIIYDKKTGSLYYDKDGKGGAEQIKFATLYKNPTIAHDDFVIAY